MTTITKHLEGKEVFLIPTGNLARRSKDTISLPVVKVARVFITLYQCPSEIKYRYEGNRLDNGHNGGYLLFKSMDAAHAYKEKMKLAQDLSRRANYFRFSDLCISDLKKIEEIFDSRLRE